MFRLGENETEIDCVKNKQNTLNILSRQNFMKRLGHTLHFNTSTVDFFYRTIHTKVS